MKKIIVFILALTMIFSVSTATHAIVNEPKENTPQYYEYLMNLQSNAVKANELLCASFPITQAGEVTYPQTFGGCYINEDKLCVLVTSTDDATLDYYKDIFDEYIIYVVFEEVTYSYNELLNASEIIAKEISETEIDVVCHYVSEIDNEVVIGIHPEDYEMAKNRRTSMPISIPYSIVKEEPINEETALVGGKKITIPAGGATLGICGIYNGYNAVLTCGHSINVGDTIIFRPTSDTIGSVIYSRYSPSLNGDFSIVRVTGEDITLTNSIADTYSITGTYLTPAVNTVVKKYGGYSGYAYATVTQRNVTGDGAKGLSVVKITYGTSQGGDSGGPYFITENGSHKFCGIHHGSNINSEEIEETGILKVYFTPYSYISSQGFTAKTS